MGDSLDSIERIETWTTEQRVKRTHRSAPEKDKQFSSVLRDEMDEEHRRKRRQEQEDRKEPQDEVILESAAEEDTDAETDDRDDGSDDTPAKASPDSDRESPPHIDVKA